MCVLVSRIGILVTEGGRFGTEIGTEPPAKISINTWHKLFNRTGRIRANAMISDQSLNERKDCEVREKTNKMQQLDVYF